VTLDFQNRALLNADMPSWYVDGLGNAVTRNLGTTGGTVQLGDGVTAASFPPQLFPHGMSFDGTGDYLRIPAPGASYSFGDGAVDLPFSIEVTVKGAAFMVFRGSWGADIEWGMYTSAGGFAMYCFTSTVAYTGRITSVGVLQAGVVSHVVGAYDGTRVPGGFSLYKNGSPITSTPSAAGVYTAMTARGGPLTVNMFPNLGVYYANSTYNVAVYPFCLQPGEVSQLAAIRRGLLNRGA
jgi:hypothetical protein